MGVVRLCAGPERAALYPESATALPIEAAAATGDGPIIVMIHGFKYDPAKPAHDPNRSLFTEDGAWCRTLGVSQPLHETATPSRNATGVAYGWPARGPVWRAVDRARTAGTQLGQALAQMHDRAPQRPIHFLTHSMGAEVAFAALHQMPRNSVGRLITLAPAAYRSTAAAALESDAGKTTEWINVTSRENAVFDVLYERAVCPPQRRDRVIGTGWATPSAATVHLDCKRSLAQLRRHGVDIAPARARICHWSTYTRPGALAFYARLIHRPHSLPLTVLRSLKDRQTAPAFVWERPLAS